MRKRLPMMIGLGIVLSLAAVQPAAAATEVGNGCIGNSSAAGTAVGLANGPTSPLPATIPSNGVITSWRVTVEELPEGFSATETLKVFRPAGPKQFRVVGESASVPLESGSKTYPTRIPVLAGDHIGGALFTGGITGSLLCETTDPGNRVGLIIGDVPNGSTGGVAGEEPEYQLPLLVFVEPDADNDGFGDETQDGCPQSALTQAPCPVVTLSTARQARKGSVTIIATSSTPAPVTVKGVAKLGKGKTATLNGGTQNLGPGMLGKFTLKFTKKVKSKLKELPPKRSLNLNVTVTGTSVSGAVTTNTLYVKLKGQAKP
jgi:hypothetical protein